MIIAIDGPAASGKGTLGRRLAEYYGLAHLDTGLLYRAVAKRVLDEKIALEDKAFAEQCARSLTAENLEEKWLRGRIMGEAASIISAYPGVRSALLEWQRRFAAQPSGAVLDGRDIGTVICPDAPVKLFVTATPQERARRRWEELARKDEQVAYEDVLQDVMRRDERDRNRPLSPLLPAKDAFLLDTTSLDAEETFLKSKELIDRAIRAIA
jgi:CMP/dCMP kinase